MDLLSFGFILVLSILSSIDTSSATTPAILLTQAIMQGKLVEARQMSLVNSTLFLNTTSYAGFLTVDPIHNSNTFFWYFPVENKPVDKTPWIIWLQGGPGVSSLSGLFDEIGPFEYSNEELKRRKYAWSNNYSMVFIDNPVGVGYSFTDSDQGFATNMTTYANHLYSALQQFLTLFSELRGAPLYLAGESYAGRFVPALASRILDEVTLPENWRINIGGLILGNPVMNREDAVNLTAAYYHWGLIDTRGVQDVKPIQDSYYDAVIKGNSALAFTLFNNLLDKLEEITSLQQSFNPLVDEYMFHLYEEFLSKKDVREAMHVGDIKYSYRNVTVKMKLIPDFLSNVQMKVEGLLEKFRILIYCGQLDLIAPCVPNAEARWQKWHWSKKEEFISGPRSTWRYDETIAGYVRSGGGLTEALVRGAGHLAPIDKPAEVLQLIESFIDGSTDNLSPVESLPVTSQNPLVNKDNTTTITPSTTDAQTNDTAKNNSSSAKNSTSEEPTSSKPSTKSIVKPESVSSASNIAVTQGVSPGTIVSISLNAILILVVVIGAFLYLRLKRRTEDFFYNNVETNSDDIFLS